MSVHAHKGVPAAQPAEEPVRARNSGPVDHHEIGELKHFLAAFGASKEEAVRTLLASSLQIVGLEEVKRQFEGDWRKIEHRVSQAAESFFGKKLRKVDTFVSLGPGRFALIFANMSRKEGQERAARLSSELINLLFGEMPGAELISVRAMVLDVDIMKDVDRFTNLEELINYFQDAVEDAEAREESTIQTVKEEFTVLFRPALNHRKKMVSIAEAVPAKRYGETVKLIAGDDPAMSGSANLRAELDLLALQEVGRAMRRLDNQGSKPVVLLSLSFETLANSNTRHKYAEALKKLPDYTRHRLILNLERVSAGTPSSRYRQILSSVRSMVLGFVLEVEKGWDDFRTIAGLPILAIGVDYHYEQDLFWIRKLFLRCKEEGMKCAWRNLDSDDMTRKALKLGVDYVSGGVIGTLQTTPARPFSFHRSLG